MQPAVPAHIHPSTAASFYIYVRVCRSGCETVAEKAAGSTIVEPHRVTISFLIWCE